jgi:hypothetical protein
VRRGVADNSPLRLLFFLPSCGLRRARYHGPFVRQICKSSASELLWLRAKGRGGYLDFAAMRDLEVRVLLAQWTSDENVGTSRPGYTSWRCGNCQLHLNHLCSPINDFWASLRARVQHGLVRLAYEVRLVSGDLRVGGEHCPDEPLAFQHHLLCLDTASITSSIPPAHASSLVTLTSNPGTIHDRLFILLPRSSSLGPLGVAMRWRLKTSTW